MIALRRFVAKRWPGMAYGLYQVRFKRHAATLIIIPLQLLNRSLLALPSTTQAWPEGADMALCTNGLRNHQDFGPPGVLFRYGFRLLFYCFASCLPTLYYLVARINRTYAYSISIMAEQQTTELTNIDLEAGSEWRFELEADENIALRVSPQFGHMISIMYAP